MAKLEIPSIVVHNNNNETGGGMERQRPLKSRLSKQAEFEELDEEVTMVVEEEEDEDEEDEDEDEKEKDAIQEQEEDTNKKMKMKMKKKKKDTSEEKEIIDKDGEETTTNKNIKMKGRSESNERNGGGGGGGRDKPIEMMPMIKAASVDGSPCPSSTGLGSAGLKERSESTSALPRQRVKVKDSSSYVSHPKVKLLQRSHALRDDTSPPPEFENNTLLSVTSSSSTSSQNKIGSSKHHRLGKQGSSTGSADSNSSSLSRDYSLEHYTDSTGVDLQQFIVDTLHKNQKDRILLLKIEQELISLVKDNKPDMKFRDQIRDELAPDEPKRSILKRDSSSLEDSKDLRSPERQLSSESRRSKSFEEREEEYGKARARIFNQDSSSSQEGAVDSPQRSHESTHNSSRRSSQEDLRWPSEPRPWSSTDSDSSNRPNKLVITKTSASTESEPSSSDRLSASGSFNKMLTKSESAESGGSRDSLHPSSSRRPGGVPKASSFGGISVLTRADSAASTKSASPRLTTAESFSSSSGACSSVGFRDASVVEDDLTEAVEGGGEEEEKEEGNVVECCSKVKSPVSAAVTSVQSQVISTTSTASSSSCLSSSSSSSSTVTLATSATSPIAVGPPLTPHSSFPSYQVFHGASTTPQQGQPVMWAVSNMESVPPGSILINPQTGQPYLNTDGSVYRHTPNNPVPFQPHIVQSSPSSSSISFSSSTTNPLILQQQTPPSSVNPPPPLNIPSLIPIQHHHQQQQQQIHPTMTPTTPPSVPTSSFNPQSPFMLCTPTLHTAVIPPPFDRRQFSVESISDLTSHLSGLTLASVPLQQHGSDILTTGGGVGEPLLVQGSTTSHHPSFTLGHTIRPSPSQQQQTSQLYFVPSSSQQSCTQQQQQQQQQSLRYICQVPYATAISQSVVPQPPNPPPSLNPHPQLGLQFQQGTTAATAAAALFESQILQQSQQPLLQPQISHQQHQQQPFQVLQGGQCFHHSYPVVGYGHQLSSPLSDATTYGVTPYYTLPSPHIPVSSSGFTYPAYAYTVATSAVNPSVVVTAGGGNNNVTMQQAASHNPSQTTFVSGPVPICGLMSSSGGGGGGGGSGTPTLQQLPPPPPSLSSHYHHHPNQNSFRPQTPPTNQSQNLALTATTSQQQQQHPSSIQCLGQSIALATPSTPNFTLYSTQVTTNPQSQQSSQQLPAAAPTSRTPPQFSTAAFAPQFLASLPLFRPNVQMMVGSHTPPPPPNHHHHHPHCGPTQNILSTAVGQQQQQQYSTTTIAPPSLPPPPPSSTLFSKGYNIPLVDQRFMKASDFYLLDASGTLSDCKGVTGQSFTAVPNGSNPASAVRPAAAAALYGRGLPLLQGDMRLIGTPLQHQMQTPIRVPLMIPQQRPAMTRFQSAQHQGFTSAATVVGRPPKIKRQRSKGGGGGGGGGSMPPSKVDSPSDTINQGTLVETERGGSRVFEVQGLPDGLRKSEIEHYVEEVVRYGAKLHFIRKNSSSSNGNSNNNSVSVVGSGGVTSEVTTTSDFVITNKVYVYAVFESETEAQNALLHIKTTKFQLRLPTSKHYHQLTLSSDVLTIS